jgi:hypothetical protein
MSYYHTSTGLLFKKLSLALAVVIISISAKGQHQELPEKPGIWKEKENSGKDTTSILYAFRNGQFHGHLRNFTMATDNRSGLTDYFANASGGGVRYETGKFRGFQFAISGFFVFNTASVNVDKKDPLTGANNRYEAGLFDLEDLANKKDIDRLEEFFLKYNFKKGHIILGRQLINTPFINLQDGRMRPTGVEGIWFESLTSKNLKLTGGWLYAVSPRSTTKWYTSAESIGIYASGVDENGIKSNYKNNLSSRGLFMGHAEYSIKERYKFNIWNLFAENIFNAAMIQADIEKPLNKNHIIYGAAQFIRQDAVNSGGNADQSKTYIAQGSKSMTFGFRAGWKNKKTDVNLNYNRITAHGRYLMPREFGRDPFFTFLPRERNEGYGDVHAIVGRVTHKLKKNTSAGLAAGYINLPDVKNFRLNKYGMPSYGQVNLDIRQKFHGIFEGFEAQLLVVGKLNLGEHYGNMAYVINKTDMMLYNLVINYHF